MVANTTLDDRRQGGGFLACSMGDRLWVRGKRLGGGLIVASVGGFDSIHGLIDNERGMEHGEMWSFFNGCVD